FIAYHRFLDTHTVVPFRSTPLLNGPKNIMQSNDGTRWQYDKGEFEKLHRIGEGSLESGMLLGVKPAALKYMYNDGDVDLVSFMK
ncbi:hypothetical protein PENTCL1PPCAC_28714, partial [Pristionchus entomophagus]